MITNENRHDAFDAVAQTILGGLAIDSTCDHCGGEVRLKAHDLASLLDDMTDPEVFDPEDVIAPLLAATLSRLRDATWERELQQAIQSATGGTWILTRAK